MRRVTLALHGLAGLRDATGSNEIDLAAAATLAELAGVDAVRLAVCEDMKPIREDDIAEDGRIDRDRAVALVREADRLRRSVTSVVPIVDQIGLGFLHVSVSPPLLKKLCQDESSFVLAIVPGYATSIQ